MKYLIGAIIGIILGSAGVVFGGVIYQNNIVATDYLNLFIHDGNNLPDGFSYIQGNIIKIYDSADNVVCYEAVNEGISCLKNN